MFFIVERGSYNQFKTKLLNLGILITFKRFCIHGLCCGLSTHTWHQTMELKPRFFAPNYALIPKKHIKFFKLLNHHNIKLGGQRLCIMGMCDSVSYKTQHVSPIEIYAMAKFIEFYPQTMAWISRNNICMLILKMMDIFHLYAIYFLCMACVVIWGATHDP